MPLYRNGLPTGRYSVASFCSRQRTWIFCGEFATLADAEKRRDYLRAAGEANTRIRDNGKG